MTSQNIPAAAGLTYSVNSYEGADNLIALLKRSRSGMDFYTPLVLACLLAVLMEGWLASLPPRGAREQVRPPRGVVKI